MDCKVMTFYATLNRCLPSLMRSAEDTTMIISSIKDIFFRNPWINCNELMEKIKERGTVRGVLFTNASLSTKAKVLVS